MTTVLGLDPGTRNFGWGVVRKNGGVWLNNDVVLRLQVDDNPKPIAELRRLVEKSPPGRAGRGRGGN